MAGFPSKRTMSIFSKIIQDSIKQRKEQLDKQKLIEENRRKELVALAAEADYMLDGRRRKKKGF